MDQSVMIKNDLALEESLEKIIKYISEKKYFKARDELLKHKNPDIAELFEELLNETDILESTIVIYRLLPKDVSVEVFSYLPSDDQLKIVDGITDAELSYIVQQLDFDDKIDVLEELPANLVDKILEKTPKDERKLINTFLNYPDTCLLYTSFYESYAAKSGCAYLRMDTNQRNSAARSLYKKLGYTEVGIVPCEFNGIAGVNLVCLEKKL